MVVANHKEITMPDVHFDSILKRYWKQIEFDLPKRIIELVSIEEDAKIFPLINYRDVDIYLLDESSKMHTNSFKALDAVICISECIFTDIHKICFSSGANTGIALTSYANRLGIETFFFVPQSNLWKLNPKYFLSPLSHLISVENRIDTKTAAKEFSILSGIPLMPTLDQRIKASTCRGIFLAEHLDKHEEYDWFVQTICAGFGPLGIYQVFEKYYNANSNFSAPRFLGIQQTGNCALFKKWYNQNGKFISSDSFENELFEQTFYDQHPETYGTLSKMTEILERSKGAMVVLNRREFDSYLNNVTGHKIRERLLEEEINLASYYRGNETTNYVEKAGLMSVIGTIKAIDKGIIHKGQRILCSFSGGAGDPILEETKPEFIVPGNCSLKETLKYYWMKR